MIINLKNKIKDSLYIIWPLSFLFTLTIILFLDIGIKHEARAETSSVDPRIEDLYLNLTNTGAVGTFTKLSIKNNSQRLQKSFAVYHEGKRPPGLEELRERYDLMVQEILILIQDKDPKLAREINTAQELLWTYLSDPEKFKSL